MAAKLQSARDVAKPRAANGFWIDHATLHGEDFAWLADTERLTLWNVKIPAGFLSRLHKLWWLDIRGGTGADLAPILGASRLRYLAVNQIRGLSDLSGLAAFKELRLLSLYGLAQVTTVPSLKDLNALERLEVGQMKALPSIAPLLEAPRLKELLLIRNMSVPSPDVAAISSHPSLERFDWLAEDVPNKVWLPVVQSISLPKARSMHPEDWFGLQI